MQESKDMFVQKLEDEILYMLKAKWIEHEVSPLDADAEPYPFKMWLEEYKDKISNMIDADYKMLEEMEEDAYRA